MTNWKEYRFGDIAEIVMGQSPKGETCNESGIGFPLLNGPTEFTAFYPLPTQYTTDPKRFSETNDLLFCVRGSTTGKMNWSDQKYAIGRGIGAIRHRNGAKLNHFVKGIIEYHLPTLLQSATGSTFPNVSREQLNGLKIKAPDLPTQTAIAEILSSLDDKIELNNKINQELENLAQTLFKQWFIDFEFPNENGEPYKSSGGEMVESELGEIPKGWDKIKLADLVTKSHTGADAITRAPIVDYDTGIKCARVGDMTNNRSFHNWAFCKIKPEDYKRQKLEIGDIIVTRTATLGINQIIRENIEAVCNNGLIRLQIDTSICEPMFIYVQFQGDVFKEWISRISGDSSTRPNMQMEYLLDFKVIIPEKELMSVFTELIKAYYDLIDENNRGTEFLITTRDTLLPKLISGELEVLTKKQIITEKKLRKFGGGLSYE